MKYEELLKQWANNQGFQTWSQDHAAVLRNLVAWLNMHAVHTTSRTHDPACAVMFNVKDACDCGFNETVESVRKDKHAKRHI